MKDPFSAQLRAAIFDMDGLLLDTEPLWGVSMLQVARQNQIPIGQQHFKHTRGLRIDEVTAYWQVHFPWQHHKTAQAVAEEILDDVIASAKAKGRVMPGAIACIQYLQSKGLKIGLATSSPMRMVRKLLSAFGLNDFFDALTSADTASMGKPHPEVFLQCAESLQTNPWQCLVFEDSINGMVAAKAARMKTVVVPEPAQFDSPAFGLADVKLRSLSDFDGTIWKKLSE